MLAQGFDPERPESPILVTSLLLTGGLHFGERFGVVYPVLPWLAVAALGLAFGRSLPRLRPARFCVRAGLASLALFALVRGLDGYGNMMLHRDGPGALQWLHVSKYP